MTRDTSTDTMPMRKSYERPIRRRAPHRGAVLAALEYTSILSAFALGYLMFSETPTPRIWLASALILTSGLVVVMVEQGRARLWPPGQGAGVRSMAGQV